MTVLNIAINFLLKKCINYPYLVEFKNICDAIIDEYSSHNMKSTSINSVLELKKGP